ncbi:MAG: hypothetical protein C0593_10780 [Marinilabiliales bacterium]|nr:MAG: hypothetical protein C0593_10780 [Marinilabiliales bacterium]
MIINELDEFRRDLKRLSKKYKSLPLDVDVLRKVLTVRPEVSPPFSYQINNLGIDTCVIKVRKIASKSFKGKGVNSGFRLVYAYFADEDRIVLVELYHKSMKENEDRDRILKNFS